MAAVKFAGVLVNRGLDVVQSRRRLPGQQGVERRRAPARALRFAAVGIPLERGAAVARGHEDGQLGLARRQRGPVAQQRTECLPAVRKLGVVKGRAQRSLDLAARPGHDPVVDGPLFR
jgi:hypothetical protein